MGFQEKERTLMTDDMLIETSKILDDINRAIKLVVGHRVSWNKACKENNLDPIKTRRKLLAIATARGDVSTATLEDMEKMLYDPYERLYKAVFCLPGETIDLPEDYKASVSYVLEHRNITEQERNLVIDVFGLESGVPMSVDDHRKKAGYNKAYGYRIYGRVIRKLRYKTNGHILLHGISKHKAEQVTIYMSVVEELVTVLSLINLEELNVSARVHNAITRATSDKVDFNHIRNAIDVLLISDKSLSRCRGVGEATIKSINKLQKDILSEHCVLSLDEFREGYYSLYPNEREVWES